VQRRAIASALIILLSIGTGALAGDLRRAGDRFTVAPEALLQANPTTPASSRKNAYLWPGVALVVAGAGLTFYGLKHRSGACTVLCVPYKTCGCGTPRNISTAIVAGGVVAALGVTLLIVGNGKKGSTPFIVLQPNGIGLGYRLKF
jgi:hypothetical protein